ncbi:Protein required for attachment to host cells [Enhydrobacter aerosaccus]|uniref:Protein required for attachment to host cells n=1 Tax=Enhydrobacter aerosaccus TaxID=225324 RepID=A0A1T4MYA7_9HYPH|nr:host attachment protein [Enhydrobacter aerosaccus]SJZ71638.1 Protein required for attachment to host cells [Enhydrobacter aerosaccus]
MPKNPITWIVVADGARARFLRAAPDGKRLVPARGADLIAPQGRHHVRDMVSDRPGRVDSTSRGGQRHAFEPKHDYHKLAKHHFTVSVADVLDKACLAKEFDEVILVAPRRSLGELRQCLSKRVQKAVQQEIPKDFTEYTPAMLWRHLRPMVGPKIPKG